MLLLLFSMYIMQTIIVKFIISRHAILLFCNGHFALAQLTYKGLASACHPSIFFFLR